MMEWMLSSSVLILVVMLIRVLTRGKINMRLRYALWAVVLIRLLIPFSFGSTSVSIMNTAQQVPIIQEAEALHNIEYIERSPNGTVEGYLKSDYMADLPTIIAQNKSEADFARMNTLLDTRDAFSILWKAGTVLMLAVFLLANAHFRRVLKKNCTGVELPDFPLPIYVTEDVETPCLCGLFRPTVYVTPEVLENPKALHYALQHELTHFHHGDFFWSALRCVCLALHWFNPLVWLAVSLSRQDAELACDEGTIHRLGDSQRIEYGNTLIDLTCNKRKPSTLLYAATTMTDSAKSIRERVTFIAKRPKTLGIAVLVVFIITTAAVGCTFTGAKQTEADPQNQEIVLLSEEELSFFNEEFFSQGYFPTSQFLTSLYKSPLEIDLFALFYNGTALPNAVSDKEIQTVLDTHPEIWADTACTKLPVKDMDTILQKYTGLTFEETLQVGMDRLVYMKDYDAYYDFHGDTNARMGVEFSAGFRQGDQVSLFYYDTHIGNGLKVVTLRDTEDGWQFLSNQYAPTPTQSAQLPETEKPFLTIPVDSLPALTPEVIQATPCTRQDWGHLVASFLYEQTGGKPNYGILVGVWPDGGIYACYVIYDNTAEGEDTYYRFSQLCDSNSAPYYLEHPELISVAAFTDLLGHDGFSISVDGRTNFFFCDQKARLNRLTSTGSPITRQFTGKNCTHAFDDGGGSDPYLLVQRGEKLYRADLGTLLLEQDSTMFDPILTEVTKDGIGLCSYFDASADFLSRCTDRIICDGTDLLFYHGDGKTYNDHLSNDIDIPEAVLETAKSAAQTQYELLLAHPSGIGEDVDDWRIPEIRLVEALEADGTTIELYLPTIEFHTPDPKNFQLTGGTVITEDHWVKLDSDYFAGTLLFLYAKESGICTPYMLQLEGDVSFNAILAENPNLMDELPSTVPVG